MLLVRGSVSQVIWTLGNRECKVFSSVPGPLQPVQRAELWCDILALQASTHAHMGRDNLNVVRHVGRLLEGQDESRTLTFVGDGDLRVLIKDILNKRVRAPFASSRLKDMLVMNWFNKQHVAAHLMEMF